MNSTIRAWREHYCRRWAREEKIDVEPNPIVVRVLKYIKSGKTLDIGAGAGRDSIYLARNGFDVEALDFACTGVERMNAVAKSEQLALSAEIGDVSQFQFVTDYDLIVCVLVLNHLSDVAARAVLERMKYRTKESGLCAISTITKEGDSYGLKSHRRDFYPDPGELKRLFADWEILDYRERMVAVKAGDWLRWSTQNVEAELIARKPGTPRS